LRPRAKEVFDSNVMHQKVSLGKHCIENYQIKKLQEPKEIVIWSIRIERKKCRYLEFLVVSKEGPNLEMLFISVYSWSLFPLYAIN
jgi:hypothetical protein